MKHRILNFLLGGHTWDGSFPPAIRHTSFRGPWILNMNTRRGRLTDWLLDLSWTLRHLPRDGRWWLADQLMRAAMRLRREPMTVFGYYDDLRGNEAAALIEDIRIDLCLLTAHDGDDGSKLQELTEKLTRLGSIAQANYTRHFKP
jgi:hypothetical protein